MLLPSCTSIRCTYCYLTTNMNGPSNKVILLSFTTVQLLVLLAIFFLVAKQNTFFLDIISNQNLEIQKLNETLTELSFQQGEKAKLISEMPVEQKILATSGVILIILAFGFFLFFYPPGIAPEVLQAVPGVPDQVFDKALWKKHARLFI